MNKKIKAFGVFIHHTRATWDHRKQPGLENSCEVWLLLITDYLICLLKFWRRIIFEHFFRRPVKQHSIICAYFLCSFVDKRQFFSPFVCCFFFVFSCIFFHGSQRPKNLRQAKGVREAIPVSNCVAIDDKAFGLWGRLEKARQIKTVRVHQQWW